MSQRKNQPERLANAGASARHITGLAPVLGTRVRALLLGSMPGDESIRHHRYYAHSRNAFWPLIHAVLDAPMSQHYPERLALLTQRAIALWDVVHQCERRGSLDSAIVKHSVVPNDLAQIFNAHPELEVVFFNGQASAQLFKKLIAPTESITRVEKMVLPSTSPAFAAMPFAQKLLTWKVAFQRFQIV